MFDKKCWLLVMINALSFKWAVVCCNNRYNPPTFIGSVNKG